MGGSCAGDALRAGSSAGSAGVFSPSSSFSLSVEGRNLWHSDDVSVLPSSSVVGSLSDVDGSSLFSSSRAGSTGRVSSSMNVRILLDALASTMSSSTVFNVFGYIHWAGRCCVPDIFPRFAGRISF